MIGKFYGGSKHGEAVPESNLVGRHIIALAKWSPQPGHVQLVKETYTRDPDGHRRADGKIVELAYGLSAVELYIEPPRPTVGEILETLFEDFAPSDRRVTGHSCGCPSESILGSACTCPPEVTP